MARYIMAAILFFAVVLRLPGLTWGLPSDDHFTPFYGDEYTVLWALSNMDPSSGDFNPRYFHNPTFHYYQVGAAIKLAQWADFLVLTGDKAFYVNNTGEYAKLFLAGRFLTLLYSCLTLFALYYLGRTWRDKWVGCAAAAIWAVTPLAVYSADLVEVSTPLAFWTVLLLIACLKAESMSSTRWWFTACFLFGICCSTKYLAAPLLIPVAITHFYVTSRMVSGQLLIGLLIAAFSFLLGTPYALLDFSGFVRDLDYVLNAAGGVPRETINFAAISPDHTMEWPVFLLCLLGLANGVVRRDRLAILSAPVVIIMMILLSRSALTVARYQLFYLTILMPFGADFFRCLWSARWEAAGFGAPLRTAVRAAVILIFAPTLLLSMAFSNMLRSSSDPRDDASAWIKQNVATESDIGVFVTPYWFSPGIVYMSYHDRDRYSMKEGPADTYQVRLGDPGKEFPFGDALPEFLVVTEPEREFLLDLANSTVSPALFESHFKQYELARTFERVPFLGPTEFPPPDYFTSEGRVPYPVVRIWRRRGAATPG